MARVAFIGVGNMGGALAKAACKSLGAGEVAISNRTYSKAERLAKELGCQAYSSNREAVQEAEYIFLCAKPNQIRDLVGELDPVLKGKVLVSVAAGVTLKELQEWAGESVPVLRIMPNTPCEIGKGLTALSGGVSAKEEHFAQVERILACSGLVERMEEDMINSYNAVAGCGPAFVYPYIEALADGGVLVGLHREEAIRYAAQMVMGAAAMVLESGKHPGALKDAVCSPGGLTIEGVAELERHGLRAAAIDAVVAAWKKGKAVDK
ncbi:MAG: pyrroline-5-carboxylate reductase [Oscillospiraceae bacterium]|jgi:pyrroline-5-carboxylate reductase|nr:pyrroline-5-carboxylate reductase [Oscillospiraceae bacterium]